MRIRARDGATSLFSSAGLRLAAVLMLSAPLSGCGGVYYAITASAAQSRLEEARQLGAENRAPYEYYYAKTHLDEAASEASEASYSDAAEYAEIAETYALKAIELAKASRNAGDSPSPPKEPASHDPATKETEGKSK